MYRWFYLFASTYSAISLRELSSTGTKNEYHVTYLQVKFGVEGGGAEYRKDKDYTQGVYPVPYLPPNLKSKQTASKNTTFRTSFHVDWSSSHS
jgi:hypothetical protein